MTEENSAIGALVQQGEARDFEAVAEAWRRDARRMMSSPVDFGHELSELIEGVNRGSPMPFSDKLNFREGEITLWVGQNGAGKSMITGQVASAFAMRGERTLICSFEMSPARTLFRMMRQALGRLPGKDFESVCFSGRWLGWLSSARKDKNPLIWLSNCRSGITPDAVCGMIRVACEENGCKHIFVDNLTKVVSGEDNFNGQKNFVSDLTQLAQDFRAHIHLVTHVRKGNSEADSIDKFSVRGTTAITDLADNVLLLQRNFDKLKKIERGMLSPEEDVSEPDTLLRIAKQRNGDCQNALINLWFDKDSTCFCTDGNCTLPRLCPDWVANSNQANREDDCPF